MVTAIEALDALKEMTTNLLYLGVGVFGLVGGYLSTQPNVRGPRILVFALSLFGVSLLGGLLVLMRLMNILQMQNNLDLNEAFLRSCSSIQIVFAVLGSVLFGIYLARNIWK